MSDEQSKKKKTGFNPPQFKRLVPMPPIKPAPNPQEQSLEELARVCKERGNRLEVMNGKAYEVTRKFLREVE